MSSGTFLVLAAVPWMRGNLGTLPLSDSCVRFSRLQLRDMDFNSWDLESGLIVPFVSLNILQC